MRASVPTEVLRIISDLDSKPAGMATPYSVHVFEEVTSTQDLAASLAGPGPALVVAARQISGRGRGGSRWLNADRAMAASLSLTPDWPQSDWSAIPLVAGLAAAEVVGSDCQLKWPNDLLIGLDKVGGILTEVSANVVVAGCGLNLYWRIPPPGMTAIYGDDPGRDQHLALAREWAGALLSRLARGSRDWGLDEYRLRSATIGKPISWEPEGEGTALDIAEDGALLVTTSFGVLRLTAGEVRHLRS